MLVREALKSQGERTDLSGNTNQVGPEPKNSKPNPTGKNQYTTESENGSSSNTTGATSADKGKAYTLDRLKREKPGPPLIISAVVLATGTEPPSPTPLTG